MEAQLSPAEVKQPAYSCSEAEETLLRELCSVNGVSYDKLAVGYGAKVFRLEIFFFGCPRIAGLHHFPNLRVLCIVNQRFGCISGLETCCNLKELWICETQVQRIEGLRHCKQLTELFLYSNHISLIEGLEGLTKLTKLWLNGNKITAIDGLDTLTELRDLNLSGNAIESIGHSLDNLSHLEVLRLSGNRLTSLQELVGLCSLSQLHTLSLCDPAYPPNPVCRLCNYSTHTLYHLPHLHWLDDREVKGHQLQQVVHGLVSSKKLYYRMREHQARMACLQECKALHDKQLSLCEPTLTCIRMLTQHIKSLQLSSELGDEGDAAKCKVLVERRRELMDYIGLVEHCRRDACELARRWTEQQCRQCSIELQSGGNIKFTAGEPSLSWYKSCTDLVNSRFSVDNTRDVGVNVTGVEIKAITRVENRMLYNRFNDKVRVLLDEDVSMAVGKHQFDYLFLIWQSRQCYVDVCKGGLCGGGPVSLSNSVNMADAPRLEEISTQNHLPAMKLAKLLNGQLLLCKVFTGKGLEEMKEGSRQHRQSNAESAARQWSVSDSDLVLPEYIIHFSYVSQMNSKDIFDMMLLEQSLQAERSEFIQSQLHLGEEEELSPPTLSHPRLAMLDTATVLQLTSQPNLSSVKELILHDHRLSRFRLSSSLNHLVKLVLSFNELTVADDFKDMPNLQILDLSFNKLSSLRGMKGLPNLVQLDISWNQLESYQHDVAVLRHHAPALSSLDANNNPWNKASGFKLHALGRLRSLHYLDAQPVTKEEVSAAAKQMTSSHLSLTSLLGVACTASAPPRSLSLLPIAEQLHYHSTRTEHVLDSHTLSANDWPTKVTSVALCNVGLSRLSCLDQLSNLQWLSLSDNALSSLEGVSLCSQLEELSVDRNLLESASGVEGLLHLKWLSLSSNCLTELPSLHNLNQLSYFNFSDNSISSLTNLKSVPSLVELYASSNAISDIRQLFCLKPLLHLVVVDFTYNPIVSTSNYRLFAIYHLPFIRALDAQPVESGELASARDKFDGRLNQDLISEKYPDIQFSSLRILDLVQSGLKAVDLSPVEAFDNLASLNLEHNSLSSFSGLIYLNKLKVLCLNHNRIESIQPHQSHCDSLPASSQVLNSLEVLHLAYNGIVHLVPLQLGRISSLRALFLQGNEIVHVDGLSGLESLTELVLDRNKIKSLQESSFTSLHNLRELHLEENRLKELSHLSTSLSHLERLYLGMNRLQEFSELEKLSGLTELMELSIVSNPVSRRLQHRSLLIFHLPSLLSLDGIMVTTDERHVAQMTFGSLHEPHEVDDIGDMGSGMPSLSHATPLKVLTVPFAQFSHSYHSKRKHNAGMQAEPAAYFQQLRKGRRTN